MTGKLVWDFTTGGPIWAQPATDPNCGCVYVASMDHKVYSLDASDRGNEMGKLDLGWCMVGTPAVSTDGTLYVGTFGKEMIALEYERWIH